MKHGLGDVPGRVVDRCRKPKGIKHPVLHHLLHGLPGGGLHDETEREVVRVGVLPVAAGGEDAGLGQAVGEDLLGGEASVGVGLHERQELGILHMVAIAGGHVRQHPDGHGIRIREVWEPGDDWIVQTKDPVVDEGQHQGGDERDRDGPIAKAHVGGGGHAGDRLPERRRD